MQSFSAVYDYREGQGRCPICGNGYYSGRYEPRKHVVNPGTPMETTVYGPEYDLVAASCGCGYSFEPPEKSDFEKLKDEVEELRRLVAKGLGEQPKNYFSWNSSKCEITR